MDELEEVSLTIDNVEFRNWTRFEYRWALDAYSTVSFTAPFEPERPEFRRTFRPLKYQSVNVEVGQRQLFAGTIVGIHPRSTPERTDVEVTAYAKPAVLGDCTAPASALPFEFESLKLYTIASTVVRPFGFRVYQEDNTGAPFDRAALEVDKEVQEFLVELAKQRGLVLTNTTFGDLLFWRSVEPGAPVANLREGASPLVSVEAEFSPQEYFSEITGFAKPKPRKGLGSERRTEPNKWLPDVLRPHSFKLDDAERGDAPEATKAKIGRMFASVASFKLQVATWRDPQGELWRPNTTLKLHAPRAMVYSPYEFLVREVTLVQTKEEGASAELDLVMPGSFSGKVPESLPWDE